MTATLSTPERSVPERPGDLQPGDRATWSLRTSFWLLVAVQIVGPAASNFPTPLFPIYEHRYGFSSGTVTLLFSAYVVALIPSLLSLGRIADRVGRRPALVAGIALTAVSSLAFACARGIAWLFAGEIIYGVAAGLVIASVAVALREAHPKASVAGGALAATLGAAVGLAIGPLVSGLLATVTPWPTVSPYVLDIVLAVALTIALARIPETRPQHVAPLQRPPVLHVPKEIRPAFIATAIAGATSWMVAGWVLGLSPSFLHEQLHVRITQPVVSGLFAALVLVANGAAQLLFRRFNTPASLRTGLVTMLVGMSGIAASARLGSLGIALVGAVFAGVGSGVVLMNTMGTIMRISPVHARGGVTSAYLSICYVAMSLPVVIAGYTADRWGLGVVTEWYVVSLVVLVGFAFAASYALERHVRRAFESSPEGRVVCTAGAMVVAR